MNTSAYSTAAYSGETCDDRILEHLIQTIDSKILIQKAINKKWSLTQMLTEAAQIEDTSLQISKMKSPDEAINVAKVQKQQRYTRKPADRKDKSDKSPPCNYCGLTGVHRKEKDCPAYMARNATNARDGTTLPAYAEPVRQIKPKALDDPLPVRSMVNQSTKRVR